MSVRQYIGARYVPRFSDVNNGIWSNVYSYEPLIIVKNGNDYYTSKQSVPVGIAITNTDYWIKTGDYNGAITEINNRINDLSSQVLGRKLTDRKFVLIGDSYAENYTSGGTTITGWIDRLIQCFGLTNSNVNPSHIYRTSGTGFYAPNGAKPWKTWINSLGADANITDVVICGGDNDIQYGNSEAALSAAITETINAAKVKFPNARISIGWIAFDLSATIVNQMVEAKRIWIETASALGCTILDGVSSAFNNKQLMLNDSHPNNAGTMNLGRAIGTALQGGCFNLIKKASYLTYEDTEITTATYLDKMAYSINDNILTIKSDPAYNGWATQFTLPGNISSDIRTAQATTLSYISELPLGLSDLNTLYSGACFINYNTAGWVAGVCRLYIWHRYLQLALGYISPSGWITDRPKEVTLPAFTSYIDLSAPKFTGDI